MASVRATPGGKFELTIRHKLLPKRIYLTFVDRAAADQYGDQCDKLLQAGIVPAGLVEDVSAPAERLSIVLLAWMNTGAPAKSDMEVLQLLLGELGALRLDQITYTWAQAWVRDLKLVANYSPGTIRKRIGALSRCLDDYLRKHPDVMLGNPLRLLPRGAATYNAQDAAQAVALNKTAKVDQVRDRRLQPGEYGRIVKALAGEKRPDRERALELKEAEALRMLFLLIFYSGLRLREAYTLRVSQLKMKAHVIDVKSSKQWYGRLKMRSVPMRKELHAALTHYLRLREVAGTELLFPWWDGDAANLTKVTARLSTQFGRLFDYAECAGLTEHDLRHEATCQWYELRDAAGQWMFRDKEVEKIMGWAPGSTMAARYASFRAEDLAERLYA
jgi:integrase